MEQQQREVYWIMCLLLFFLERDFILDVALGLVEFILTMTLSFN